MVVFWDLTSGEAHTKNVGNLKFLAANGDVCAVVIAEKGDPRVGKKMVCYFLVNFYSFYFGLYCLILFCIFFIVNLFIE